jgi:hypothetical protein
MRLMVEGSWDMQTEEIGLDFIRDVLGSNFKLRLH